MKMCLLMTSLWITTSVLTCSAEEFSSYLTQFEEASQKYGPLDLQKGRGKFVNISKLTVRLGKKQKETELGRCEWPNGIPTVVMDADSWNEKPERREMVIFHEFGHCLLEREHCEGLNRDGIPRSIMRAQMFNPEIYYANRDYYLSELFYGPKKECPVTPRAISSEFATGIQDLSQKLLNTNGIGN